MSCNMKYRYRRKVWWKPGEVIYNPRKLDLVTWKILCQENNRNSSWKEYVNTFVFWSRNVRRRYDGIS